MCFAPQRRAIFHLSSGQLAPRPPLQRAYFSTLRSHKSLEKHSAWRLSYLFAHLDLLLLWSSSSLLFSDSAHLPILSEVWLLNFLRWLRITENFPVIIANPWLDEGMRPSPAMQTKPLLKHPAESLRSISISWVLRAIKFLEATFQSTQRAWLRKKVLWFAHHHELWAVQLGRTPFLDLLDLFLYLFPSGWNPLPFAKAEAKNAAAWKCCGAPWAKQGKKYGQQVWTSLNKSEQVWTSPSWQQMTCANHQQTFFPHIQEFKSNQGSHVILVALICSINIEPFRKNRESKKLNLALGLRVTSNSATLKFTREEPPSGLLTLRMPEPTVDPTNYWNQSRPMILRQNIPEFYQVRFAMDPTLSNILVCDGSYFVQH